MKLFFAVLCFLTLSKFSFGQDTTWVQTFTFDSISTRRAEFQFPAELDDKRFEKILMYYTLKCSPLTQWDQYNCGEWDYLTYTRVFDHTGVMDSVQRDSLQFLANYSGPATYAYNPQGYAQVDQHARVEQKRTGVSTTLHPMVMTADGTTTSPFNVSNNGSRFQYLISATDLLAAGIAPGNLQSLSLDIASITGGGDLINPTIRIKSTSLTELLNFETTNFTTVYENSHGVSGTQSELVIGVNELLFFQPFNWNGTDNIVVEFVFDRPITSTNQIVFNAQTISSNSALSYESKNGVLNFNGTNKALLELSDFELGNEFTIAFWAKGNGSSGTNTSILEAYDTLNNRVINIHFPWSDNTLYFDAGQGSGYDRISKAMTLNEIDYNWNHWAFTKNATTGEMKIYKNGTLWHSGTAKNSPLGNIHRFVLGKNWNGQYSYKGKMDEFQLFDLALDQATIAANFKKKTTSAHPNWNNLLTYYDFDEVEYAVDHSQNDFLLMPSTYGMFDFSELPSAGVNQELNAPIIGFGQSADAGTISNSVATYEKLKEPQVIFEFAEVDHHFEIVDAFVGLPSGNETIYNETNQVVSSTPFIGSETINNAIITYFEAPFELINDVEIGRFITPYGISFDLGPQGFAWVYDVTDYQEYFTGLVDLAAHNTQELIDLKFAFIEGIPPRDVHHRQPIWSDYKSYLYKNMDDDTDLSAVQIALSDTSSMFKIKSRFTGHGHNGSTNCCEWDPKQHMISVDGVQRFSWDIWEESACGDNPNISQGGTWPYAREGWCPGDLVKEYDHELTPYVTPGTNVTLDYDITDVPFNDQAQGNGNYVVAMDLISYSAPNFQHDAALADILNPTSFDQHSKWNPSCVNPRVIIQNTGEQNLTSCIVRVWITYGNYVDYAWTGNLAFLEKEVVEIPVTDNSFWMDLSGENFFYAQVYAVNGYPDLDEYANNNLKKTKFSAPESITGPFYIWFKSNNQPEENSYRLEDAAGNIIFERSNLTASTEYKDTFDLEMGCYSLIVEDYASDGLSFWYSAQVEGETAGFCRVRKVGGSMIEQLDPDFGNYSRYNFSVGFTVGVEEKFKEDKELLVFPNPNDGNFTIELAGNIGSSATLELWDITGRMVYTEKMGGNAHFAQSKLSLSFLNSGNYIAVVRTDNSVYTKKFIKN